jgi:uncharacterized protein (TIGR00730 family)
MRHICVFAGSSAGADPRFARAAAALGRAIAERGNGLVYGGANVGLMGILADAVLEAGGRVVGVIPAFLVDKEIAHRGVSELTIVQSMHERKAAMAQLASGFVALPGGFGTMEEFLEILTWAQLGLHDKPCGLLNAGGYYDGLLHFLDTAVAERLLKPAHRAMVLVDDDAGALLDRFASYSPAAAQKWIARDLT